MLLVSIFKQLFLDSVHLGFKSFDILHDTFIFSGICKICDIGNGLDLLALVVIVPILEYERDLLL